MHTDDPPEKVVSASILKHDFHIIFSDVLHPLQQHNVQMDETTMNVDKHHGQHFLLSMLTNHQLAKTVQEINLSIHFFLYVKKIFSQHPN